MASAKTPKWKRLLIKYFSWLFKICPQSNYHWRWDRLCFCGQNEYVGDWHGGIYDLKSNKEYQYCKFCH